MLEKREAYREIMSLERQLNEMSLYPNITESLAHHNQHAQMHVIKLIQQQNALEEGFSRQHHALSMHIEQVCSELEDKRRLQRELAEQLVELTSSCQSLRAQQEEKDNLLGQLDHQYEAALFDREKGKAILNRAAEGLKKAQIERNQAEHELRTLRKDIDSVEHHLAKGEHQISDLNHQLKNVRQELEEMQTESNNIAECVSSKKQSKDKTIINSQNQQQRNKKLAYRLVQCQSKRERLLLESHHLRNGIAISHANQNKLLAEITEGEKQLILQQRSCEIVEDENEQLECQAEKKKEESRGLQGVLDDMRRELAGILRENERIVVELEKTAVEDGIVQKLLATRRYSKQ